MACWRWTSGVSVFSNDAPEAGPPGRNAARVQRLVRAATSLYKGLIPPCQVIAMLNDIYNRRILELAGDIPRLGRLERPDASATAHSKLCGSTVTVDLNLADGKISDFAHDVKACALGQASSSIMARNIVGSTPDELRALRDSVQKMLKENGAAPTGRWEDVAVLEPVRDYKARHASTLLTFDAVVSALDKIEAGTAKAPASAAG
jgi:NifU-like protein involved in Fe-S cluster formation